MNNFGAQTVAAITASYRVDGVIMLPIINLGYGISTIIAQNKGSKKYNRILGAVSIGFVIMLIISSILTLLVTPNGRNLVTIFGVSSTSAEIGAIFFRIISPFYIIFGISIVLRSFLEGIGDVIYTGFISIIALCVRLTITFLGSQQFGNSIIPLAEGLSWLVLLILCGIRFLRKKKTFKNIINSSKE